MSHESMVIWYDMILNLFTMIQYSACFYQIISYDQSEYSTQYGSVSFRNVLNFSLNNKGYQIND